MKRAEDSPEAGGPCYTLYLEYLGGLVPILKGRRISKLRPEFVIMDPKTDSKAGAVIHDSPIRKQHLFQRESTVHFGEKEVVKVRPGGLLVRMDIIRFQPGNHVACHTIQTSFPMFLFPIKRQNSKILLIILKDISSL